jgi:pilus assembly protein Flp/PilA
MVRRRNSVAHFNVGDFNLRSLEVQMKAFVHNLCSMVRDDQGGEVLEYALVAGLIVIAAIATIASVGTKVLARWNSLNASM